MKITAILLTGLSSLCLIACSHSENTGSHTMSKAELKKLNDENRARSAAESLQKIDGVVFDKIESPEQPKFESMKVVVAKDGSGYRYQLSMTPKGDSERILSGSVTINGDSDQFESFSFDDEMQVSDLTKEGEKLPSCLHLDIVNKDKGFFQSSGVDQAPIIICK